ncbi:ALP1-like protein isoform X1 [Tanacetum coccineum]
MNPFFPMNQNNNDEERHPIAFEIDEETDIYFLEQAYTYHEQLQQEENHPRLTRNSIHRDREGAEERLMDNYFDDHSAVRQLAYGNTPDVFNEYLQMSEHTARDCLFHFNNCIISLYMAEYLRKPTLEDEWKNVQYHGMDNTVGGDKKYPTIMLEVVASHDLWIWHAFFRVAGANNDINVLDTSLLFDDLLDDKAHVAPYVVNGVGFEKGYYLADGIYPQWATFVKSFTIANDAKHAYFKKRQESARKDVKRAFGVLQGCWRIIQQLARQYHVNNIRRIMYSCIIMHNMILEDQKMTVFDRNDVYANPSRNMQRTWVERYGLSTFGVYFVTELNSEADVIKPAWRVSSQMLKKKVPGLQDAEVLIEKLIEKKEEVLGQNRIRRPFSVSEVEALVQAVEKL